MEKYNHKEAFCLMTYKCQNCGNTELIWNSRDGVTPFITVCPKCEGPSQHINWNNDICIPNLRPLNLRWFIDLTKEKYEKMLDKRFKQIDEPYKCTGGDYTKKELIELMLEDLMPGEPDILEISEIHTNIENQVKEHLDYYMKNTNAEVNIDNLLKDLMEIFKNK